MRRCVNRHDRGVQDIAQYRKSAQHQTQGHTNCDRESESEGKLRQTDGDIVEKPARADDLKKPAATTRVGWLVKAASTMPARGANSHTARNAITVMVEPKVRVV